MPSERPEALRLPTFGDLPGTQILPLQIWFKPRNQTALNELLADQQNPNSPRYHQWLTPQEYTSRFGVTQQEYEKVARWLTREGFAVSGGSPRDGYLRFSGSVLTIGRAFNTRLMKFNASGSKFGNLRDPVIPAEFAPTIGSVRGLNNLERAVPLHTKGHSAEPRSETPAQQHQGGQWP